MPDSRLRRPRLPELFVALLSLSAAGVVTFAATAPPPAPHSSRLPALHGAAFRPDPRPLPGSLGPVAVSGTINGASQSVTCPVGDQGTVTCQVTGTWSATLIFEGTVDNLTWATIRANAIASDTLVTAPAANGLYVLAGNFTAVRVRDSAYTSGSAVITMRATPSSSANVPVSSVGGGGGGGGGTVSGSLTNNNAAPAGTNIGSLDALANAAAPSWTEGNQVFLSTDLSGRLRTLNTPSGTQAVSGTVTITPSGTQTVSGTVAATQSGTWTVQPGNTANTTAWKVDGSAVTQPVSGTVTITPSGTQTVSGTVTSNQGTQGAAGTASWNVQGAGAAGAAVVGNPVLVGGSDGTNAQAWKSTTTTPGFQRVSVVQATASVDGGTSTIGAPLDETGALRLQGGLVYDYNGATLDRHRNNTNASIRASTGVTVQTVNTDVTTYDAAAFLYHANVTNYNGGTLTVTLQWKDANGLFVTIPGATTGGLTSGADIILAVGPSAWPANTATAFYVNYHLPRLIRVVETVGTATITMANAYELTCN